MRKLYLGGRIPEPACESASVAALPEKSHWRPSRKHLRQGTPPSHLSFWRRQPSHLHRQSQTQPLCPQVSIKHTRARLVSSLYLDDGLALTIPECP